MRQLASPAGRVRSALSPLFAAFALILLCSAAARADTWNPGDMLTYPQSDWGDTPAPGNAAALLMANYDAVYVLTSGVFELGEISGGGFSMLFTNPTDLLLYLPADGSIGTLTSDYLNPSATSSGEFGGDVAALKLNIDFSGAGLVHGTLGFSFGNVVLGGFDGTSLAGLDGMSLIQFLALDDIALSGGSAGYTFSDLATLTEELDASFGEGGVSTFAQDHLLPPTVTATPEPSSVVLLASGLLALGALRCWQRRQGFCARSAPRQLEQEEPS